MTSKRINRHMYLNVWKRKSEMQLIISVKMKQKNHNMDENVRNSEEKNGDRNINILNQAANRVLRQKPRYRQCYFQYCKENKQTNKSNHPVQEPWDMMKRSNVTSKIYKKEK